MLARAFSLVPLLCFAAGCSGGAAAASTTTSGSGGSGGQFVTAPHPPFPVLDGSSTAVIAHPKLVTLTFQGSPNTATIEAAGDAIVASSWLLEVGAEYGVGAGEHLAKVSLPGPAPAALDDPALLTMLDQQIQGGLAPAPTADTIYMLHLPEGMSFDDGDGYAMCTDYLGYHWQADVPSGKVTYAIVGDCGDGIEEVTATLAHELIEAATDPGPAGGFYLQPAPSDPWYALDGYENADLCDYAEHVVEGGFSYQRSWSNAAAAAAATSPCAPIDPDEVFYDVSAEPATIPTVAAGQSATFTLTGWSTAPMGDWELGYDASYYGEFEPTVELGDTVINNGKQVSVTLTVPPLTQPGLLGVAMIYSGDGHGRFWPVTVRSK